MKLFLIHLGYYDNLSYGVFESHTNRFILAENEEDARAKMKASDFFKENKMHIDGLQCIEAVEGHRIELKADDTLHGETLVSSHQFRGL